MDELEEFTVAERDDRKQHEDFRLAERRKISRGTASAPEITSMDQAVAFVEALLEDIAPWPEAVTVLDPAAFRGQLSGGQLHERLGDERFTLPEGAVKKMQAIRSAVTGKIFTRGAAPRLPELMLASSAGAVAFVWDPGIYQAL